MVKIVKRFQGGLAVKAQRLRIESNADREKSEMVTRRLVGVAEDAS
jgi:hypothetical protein